jgi:CRISPR-associated exonuclease Cas4
MEFNYNEDQLLALSGIQHFYFCRRQWALIHVERQWQENVRTLEGRLLHKRTDDPFFTEKRHEVIIARAMPVVSYQLGLYGICDVVEFHQSSQGVRLHGREGNFLPMPIEYKRGEPKYDQRDEVQLCAQALCLEEMLSVDVPKANFFYAKTRKRHEITISNELKVLVRRLASEMHEYFERGFTPKVKPHKGCNHCSLKDLCLPTLMGDQISVHDYILHHIEED